MDGCIDGWMDGWREGGMDGWMGVLCLEISDFDINYVYTQAKYRQQSLSLYLSLSLSHRSVKLFGIGSKVWTTSCMRAS